MTTATNGIFIYLTPLIPLSLSKERGKVFRRRVSPFSNYPYLVLPCSLTIPSYSGEF
jgi:hypothetical protein